MNPTRRAVVDLLGCLLFLIPFCLLVISASLPFVENSYSMAELSPDPGGLPARWLLKAAIPFGFALLMIQGLALTFRSGVKLFSPDDGSIGNDGEHNTETPLEKLLHDEQDHLL